MTTSSAPTLPPLRPVAVVFDVVETLFSLDPVARALERSGVGEATLEVFFARLLRDAFALGSLGEYRPFAEFATGSLSVVAPSLDQEGRGGVLAAFAELTAHPDVVPAFERLRGAGVRIAALTNGSATNTTKLLERNRLDGFVEIVMSVDDVRAWKPQAAPYRYAADRLALERDRVAMVAVHAWDVHGARQAGLVTGWASRLEGNWAPVFAPADIVGTDLIDVVDGLLRLPEPAGR